MQPKGRGQFIQQFSYYTNNEYFDFEGVRTSQSRFTKYEFQPYVEYGLLDNLTIGATGYAQRVQQSGENNSGIADPEFFARSVLWQNDVERISIQPLIKFKSQFESHGTPRGGSKSTDMELSLLYGKNLHIVSDRDYLDMRAAYRYRSGRLNNQLRSDAALGLAVAPAWWVIPAIRTITATTMEDSASFSENGDQDFDLTKAEITILHEYAPSKSAGLTLFSHVMGAQTGNGMGAVLSLSQGF